MSKYIFIYPNRLSSVSSSMFVEYDTQVGAVDSARSFPERVIVLKVNKEVCAGTFNSLSFICDTGEKQHAKCESDTFGYADCGIPNKRPAEGKTDFTIRVGVELIPLFDVQARAVQLHHA